MFLQSRNERIGRLQRRAERGAVATIIVTLLGAGVLLGAAALAVDVGNIMLDRRQQQNAADAGARKLATICATDVTKCNSATATTTSGVTAAIQGNFSGNAGDHSGQIKKICGRVPSATITACASATSDADLKYLGECPPIPSKLKTNTTIKYVEVYSKVLTAAGGDQLPGFLGKRTSNVDACARYAWGPAKKTGVLPLTFGECEWADAVGATYNAATGQYDTSGATYGKEIALAVNYDTKKAKCANFNGHDYPGGFGWLDHPTNICDVTVDDGDWVAGWPGNGTGNDCLPNLNVGDEIYIPIYNCINDAKQLCPNTTISSKTYYHLAGMAAFKVTAIDLTGKAVGTPGGSAKAECQNESNNKQCIYGMFLKDLVSVGEINPDPTDTDYGLSVVEATG